MLRRRGVGLAAALGVALIAAAPEARAFVRETDSRYGNPLRWASSCEVVTVYLNGFSQMSADEVAKSIAGAAHTWGPDAVDCPPGQAGAAPSHPYFDIIPQMSTAGSAPPASMDGHNSITFVTDSAQWVAENYPPEALAVTTPSSEPSGQIVGAKVEINATDPTAIAWANLDPGTAPAGNAIERFDLQTVMTHELGHFLGLSHTCITPSGSTGSDTDNPTVSVDDQGVAIPACTEVPDGTNATAAPSVMWFEVQPESTVKRSLAADDVAAVCDIYPAANQLGMCPNDTPDDACGCSIGSEQGRGTLIFAAVLAALFMLGRRAGGRRSPPGHSRIAPSRARSSERSVVRPRKL